MTIDNGNHLLLSGNHAALDYLRGIGAEHRLVGPPQAEFSFVDLASGERWTLRFNDGRLPFWIFDPSRRVPGTRALDYLPLARLLWARPGKTVGDVIACDGAALSAAGRAAAARGAQHRSAARLGAARGAVIRETLAAGGRACRPLIARDGLGATLIEPALCACCDSAAPRVRLEHQLRAIALCRRPGRGARFRRRDDRARRRRRGHPRGAALCRGAAGARPRGADRVPRHRQRAISASSRRPGSRRSSACSTARCEWIFAFPGRLSVTISAGDRLLDTRARRAGEDDLERGRARDRAAGRVAALADRARAARHFRRDAGAGRQAPGRRNRNGAISCSPAIGPTPACRPPSKARSAPAIAPPNVIASAADDATHDDSTRQHRSSARREALLALPARRRPLGVRARGRRHHSGRICAAAALSRRAGRCRARSQDRRLSAPHPGRPRRLAAVPRRRSRHQRDGEGLFRAEDDRRFRRCRPHAPRPRGGAAPAAAPRAPTCSRRIMLALFGFVPWRAVPVMPVEIMLLPKWFPFHLDKISYWSRTVIVPLLVLMAKKPRARNAKGVRIDELFLEPPQTLGPAPKAPQQKASWFWFFRGVDNVLRAAEPYFPKRTRQRAIDRAVAWVTERLNGEDGLGAIFPAMANSVMMFDVLGYPESHPQRAIARKSVEKLLVVHEHEAYCQPCVSPIWDTGLVCHALLEVGGERATAAGQARPRLAGAEAGARRARRLDRAAARSAPRRLGVPICQAALSRRRRHRRRRHGDGSRAGRCRAARLSMPSLARAREWIVGMQSDERRLGRVRRRQRILLSQQHSVRRSRRAARSADRGRHRALRVDAGAIRRDRRQQRGGRRAPSIICAAPSLPTAAGTAAGA